MNSFLTRRPLGKQTSPVRTASRNGRPERRRVALVSTTLRRLRAYRNTGGIVTPEPGGFLTVVVNLPANNAKKSVPPAAVAGPPQHWRYCDARTGWVLNAEAAVDAEDTKLLNSECGMQKPARIKGVVCVQILRVSTAYARV